ncbi:Uma2 family endonuclease [Niabella beijingensis]|uniref:Uma2 family endonuclease n=1 Tax=Niabella beijingensis TaxID=2872700 RepID=UPI001CBF1331|nr:Uma2 family endonuclease [Niabella beijingensis]
MGAVFATAGAGRRHHIIFKNTLGQLYMLLSGNDCQPYGSDMRIHIPENTLFTYPDISIICGDMVAPAEDENTAVLPAVLIEILPPLQKIMTAAENSGCAVISLL